MIPFTDCAKNYQFDSKNKNMGFYMIKERVIISRIELEIEIGFEDFL